jgi:hypothetical protein
MAATPRHHKTEKTLNKTQQAALEPHKRRKPIPQALRWQVWLQYAGEHYKAKCAVPWCMNIMRVTDFQAGHKQADAAGGETTLENLIPICASCNLSMGTEHFNDWARRGQPVKRCCFSLRWLWRTLRGSWPVYPKIKSEGAPSKKCCKQSTQTQVQVQAQAHQHQQQGKSHPSPPDSVDDIQVYTYLPPQPLLDNQFAENV